LHLKKKYKSFIEDLSEFEFEHEWVDTFLTLLCGGV
jgi:hypothetical protein